MGHPLPFADFLTALKTRGIQIGVAQYQAAGRLLAKWDSTNLEQLKQAFAALLARNDDDIDIIKATFDECFKSVQAALPPPLPAVPSSPPFSPKRWPIALMVLLLLLLGTANILYHMDLRPIAGKDAGLPDGGSVAILEAGRDAGRSSV